MTCTQYNVTYHVLYRSQGTIDNTKAWCHVLLLLMLLYDPQQFQHFEDVLLSLELEVFYDQYLCTKHIISNIKINYNY